MCLCFGCGGVGGVGGEWVCGLGQGLGGLGGVMSVCVVSLDSLCTWQVQVSVYCATRIPAHIRCTQCSILLHLIEICFLTCICLWQISLIQTCLRMVVRPGLVSTSPAFMRSIASHPAGPHGRLAKNGNRAPIAGGGRGRHNVHRACQTAVTAPLRVGCVVWSPQNEVIRIITGSHKMSSIDHIHSEIEMLQVEDHLNFLSAPYLIWTKRTFVTT